MVTEDYVSFETAKLLKEKGFDIPVKVWYGEYTSPFSGNKYNVICFDGDIGYEFIAYVPTLQMAMKWLRETHGIEVTIDVCKVGEDHRTMYSWTPVVVKEDRLEYPISQPDGSVFGGLCDGYGQAVEKGIEYCLENLV